MIVKKKETCPLSALTRSVLIGLNLAKRGLGFSLGCYAGFRKAGFNCTLFTLLGSQFSGEVQPSFCRVEFGDVLLFALLGYNVSQLFHCYSPHAASLPILIHASGP